MVSEIYQFTFIDLQNPPLAGGQIAEPKISDAHPDQPQGRMADGGGHPPHLTVFAFNQFQPNPAIGNAFAETNRRLARGN
jgi:hypothetical protein